MTQNFTSLQKMNRNLLKGIILISAVALSSCSVNRTASTFKNNNDDVYFSHATAGEEPVYITRNDQYNQDGDDQTDEDDYFYYDDYASRINRFGYYSPFGYYDNLYYGYGGYGGLGYGSGFNIGLGFGYGGYGYGGLGYGSPWYYGGLGYGWGGYGGFGYGYPWGGYGIGGYYSPYSFWGIGYGYGGSYWGGYSAYRSNPRPFRGNGSPGSSFGGQSRSAFSGRSGTNTSGIGYIPNRGTRNSSGNSSYGDARATRGVRTDRPAYTPNVERSAPSSSSFGGGGGRSSGGGGGGGGRPVRN